MDALIPILFTLGIIAAICAAMLLILGLFDSDGGIIALGLVLAVASFWLFYGSHAALNRYNANWWAKDAVVRTVFTEADSTLMLTSGGTVYRCVTPSECSGLVKGDHVQFEMLPAGSSITGTPDARNVRKG